MCVCVCVCAYIYGCICFEVESLCDYEAGEPGRR
jgi:hypothetical protein